MLSWSNSKQWKRLGWSFRIQPLKKRIWVIGDYVRVIYVIEKKAFPFSKDFAVRRIKAIRAMAVHKGEIFEEKKNRIIKETR